jgi:predicted nucleic acid-binding protein
MKRVVLDTSVVASAFRSSRGASFVILGLVAEHRLVPLVSTALFLEYEDVRDFQQAVPKFGVPILTPGALLERIRK